MTNRKASMKYLVFIAVFALMTAIVFALVSFNEGEFSPNSGFNTSNPSPVFMVNASSSADPTINCSLFIDETEYNVTNNMGSGVLFPMIPNTSLTEGTHIWYVNCTDTDGINKSLERGITVDYSPPGDYDSTDFNPELGYGKVDDPDGFFSTASGNNVINLSINITDAYTYVHNVTFDFSEVCSGVVVTKTDDYGLVWWANCTVDQQGEFDPKNIYITACDIAGNCNDTLFRTVFLYNYTLPPNETTIRFGSATTDLSTQLDLAHVNYVLDILLNGSQLPGTPWIDFQRAALLNFTSLNFTALDLPLRLQLLGESIDITISAPRAFDVNRIYVNSSAFAELDSATIITLYNLPFTSEPNITGDADAAGGISIISWVSDGNQGNLTFSVDGFSGYNVSDIIEPIVSIDYPADGQVFGAGSVTINVTANGTGTEISNVVINIDGADNSWLAADFTCTAVSPGSELFTCNYSTSLSEGPHTITATAFDYGGESPGNNATTAPISIGVDLSGPSIYITNPADGDWSNDNTTAITFNFTDIFSHNASCTVYVDGVAGETNTTVLNNTATTLDASELSDGTGHSVWVNCTDVSGNEGSSIAQTLNIDTVAPSVIPTNPPDDNLTTNSQPQFMFTLTDVTSPNSTCILYVGAAAYNTSILSNGTGTLIPDSPISDGNYYWNVTCTDLATNAGASTARNITIDTGAPVVKLLNTSFNTSVNITSITFNFTDTQATANCSLYFNGVRVDNNASTLVDTNTVLTTASELSDGIYTVYVNCTDDTGFTGKSATIISVTIDTTGPTVIINSPSDGGHVYDNTTGINFTVSDEFSPPFSCTVYLNGSHYGSNSSVSEDIATIITNSTERDEGTYLVVVNCTDNVSNLGTSGVQTFVIDRTAPEISDISASGTSSSTTTGTATITATTNENGTCWYSDSNFTAENTSVATLMSGSGSSSHSFGIGYSADGTIGPYYISCMDSAGNNMTSSNVTDAFTVSVTEYTPSGGGGGGGGGISNPSTSQTWLQITPGAAAIMKISSDDFGIKEIQVDVKNPSQNVKIEVVKLPGKPASVTKNISGKVYRYLEIKKTNLNDSDLWGNVKLRFQISQSWLLGNSVNPEKMVLKRFVNEKWEDLNTVLLSTDSKYAYYEAGTPGFSYFAISEKSEVPVAVVPKAPDQPPVTESPAEKPEEQPSEQQPPAEQPGTEPGVGEAPKENIFSGSVGKTVLGMVIIIVVIILIVAWISKGGKIPRIKMPRIPKLHLFRKHSRFKTLEDEK